MDNALEKSRIDQMIDTVMKVARGDYHVQIGLSGKNDELDSLAMGLNMMIDDIRTSYEDLDQQKRELSVLNQNLQESLAKVKTLSGLLPICAWCKKLRDDEGYWKSVEEYISAHTGAEFTHGMCPECQNKYFAEHFTEEDGNETNYNKVS